MKNRESRNLGTLIAAMCIFGTIGIFREYIPLPSSLIALVRGAVGSGYLLISAAVQKQKPDLPAIKKNLPLLVLSGAAIGFNWIFLFEAYFYTTVATATLCYYLAPVMVIALSPLFLKEKLTLRRGLCTLIALAGMIPVSGILDNGLAGSADWKGILYGLAAAVLYAGVMLMNKKMSPIPANDKTVVQLISASVVLAPYVLATEDVGALAFTPASVALLLVVGILHTGIAYRMYFAAMSNLKAQTTALFSYLDPIMAIVLSAVILGQPAGWPTVLGAAMILGSAIISEQ
jgi:RarD protein